MTSRSAVRARSGAPRRRAVQWPAVLWLTIVWWVLWGSWTALSLVSGVLVAVVVCLVFPLPPLMVSVRIRPVAVLTLLAHFLLDVVVASVQVAGTVLAPPRDLRNAIVRVPLRTDSDLVLTAVAEMVSLVPGTVVVEVHRDTHTLFLHVLDVRSEADVDAVRLQVLGQEDRILRAFAAPTAPTREATP